ncbi:protein FAM32A-like [Hydractinia symbiolongicarpus]|uniref:protein FAM32A-like n=1 Tax=Hydractinia symbiolongicarpus TaxID=13093 RepID=UPI002549D88B|nr:protein FAM32A-like [Hydractinia symbiolongicarpus]
MADDDPYDGVTGGGLKLKIGKIKKNKKKKKNKAKDIVEQSSHPEVRSDSPVPQDAVTSKKPRKTAAELAFEKSQEKRAAERILKKASKTHKQRVEELNEYLGELSEHYDIQKVSWTK